MSNFRCRGWCFTINNDTYEDLDLLLDMEFSYLVFGFEKGLKGTPHIQGYVYFENAKTQSAVKLIMPRAHLSGARGNADQNYDYCSKDGDFYEFGDRPECGKRTDLLQIKGAIIGGASMESIMEEYPSDYVRYFKGFEKISNFANKQKIIRDVKITKAIDLDHDLENTFYCSHPSQLNHYDNEETLVIFNSKSFDTYALELFNKGHPYYTATKIICPLNVIYVTA